MQKNNFIFIILLFIYSFSFSNNINTERELKKIYHDAEYSFIFDLFDEAADSYLKILEKQPDNSNIHYKLGLCYLQIAEDDNIKKAVSQLELAVKKTSEKYKNKYKEKNAPLYAWIYYADALRLDFQFEKAINTYEKYKELNPKDKQNKEYLKREIQNCKNAIKLVSKPISITDYTHNYHLKRIGEYESCPVISINEDILVFSFGKDNILPPDIISLSAPCEYKTDDIYYTTKENGVWQEAINITKDLNVKQTSLPTSISADGDVLYLVQDDNDDGNIYISKFKDGKWSKVEKLNKNINSKYWETYASISSDNKTIYFSSDRKGGYGGFDIYKSVLSDDGKWGKAINLGEKINTIYDEDTPNITRDGKKLYFSSQGHTNMGGFDIFKSEIKDGEFLEAKNIGYPLNTPGNDLFVLTQYSGQIAFSPLNNDVLRGLSDNQDGEIFVVVPKKTIVKVRTEVIFANNLDSLPKDILIDTNIIESFKNLRIDKNIISFETEKDSLELKIFANNTDTTIVYAYKKDTILNEINLLVKLNPIIVEPVLISDNNTNNTIENQGTDFVVVEAAKVKFKEIYFDFDKSSIKTKYNNIIDEVYEKSKQDSNKQIIIKAYTDPIGPSEYNLKLSQRRSDAIKNDLIKKGISPDKIIGEGLGETDENSNNYYNRKAIIYFSE